MTASRSPETPGTDLAERVAAQLAPLLPPRSSVLIGLSGGVDSVVLLHLLQQLASRFSWQLSALHVHHGISPHADSWAKFCADLCARYSIALRMESVDIAPLRAHGIEAAARKLRHAAFARQSCDFIALAHHADDQVETMLLQLLRGAGVRGASAMPVLSISKGPVLSSSKRPILDLSKQELQPESPVMPRLVRPLLHCSRQEIIGYAKAHQLQWIEDESNADDSYPRNFLRHRVLPLLNEKFPAYRNTLARSAQHFAEANILLDELAQQDGAHAIHAGALAVEALRRLSPARARSLLRYFLHSVGAPMPQTVQLDDMLQQLCNARTDSAICIEYGSDTTSRAERWQVRRYQDGVYALPALNEFKPDLVLPWHGETELAWPPLSSRLSFRQVMGQGISRLKLQSEPVTLRVRCGGETLRPEPHAATRTLKNLFQEHRIPPWQRERLPLLFCGDKLVCVPGVAVAAEYRAEKDEEGILLSCD
ncbi:MAG TPA: tRNA lysidine(34) synthetase TilS [Gallionella sp.]|nr:tRNA lysidine(34) synthetase TilS [Gallionella sp.]